MAIQPDLVGTVTLTSGQTGFTVAGINLVTADVREGDQIVLPAKGLVLTIGSRTNATTGALTYNCPAAADGAAQPCRIRFQSDLSRMPAATRDLLEKLASGNLEALAGLTLAANKGIHATGAGTLAAHDLTPFARTLLDDANGAAMYATLGQIPNAQVPARLRESSANVPSNDYNLAVQNGFYVGPGAAAVNGPPGSSAYGPLLVSNRGSGAVTQIASFFRVTPTATYEMYTRGTSDSGANWTQWLPLIAAGGTNANGTFVRFADGTQICSHRHSTSGITSIQRTEGSIVNGHFYNFSPVTFPAAFASNPIISMVSDEVLLGSSARVFSGMQCYAAGPSNFSYRVWATLSFDTFAARYVAIGRWF